jgi:aspartate/methionine/tyrosine aminotransferase
MCDAYHQCRDIALELLNEHHLNVFKPGGAFYIFANISMCHMDTFTFARRLLEERGVAVRPGELFGPAGRGYVRVSFAASQDAVTEGLVRMADFVRRET